ncbi:MAG: crotonase/enoyl-CoA hydratase family protein [Ilumatobacteraceae bacterium]
MPDAVSITFRDRVSITVTDGVADVRLTRADKRNALDSDMFLGIAEAGEWLCAAPGILVAVLSGEGQSFCAGLDFATMSAIGSGGEERPPGNPGEMRDGRITHLGQQVCWVWQEVPVPVIAAVHGHALGGGLQVALGADIRIVHPDTQLSVREVHWGLVPDMTGTFFLAQLVGADVAKELVFTARIFDGRAAKELGIATHVSDDPYAHALSLAGEIAGRSPDAVRASKRLLNELLHQGAAAQFAAERQHIGSLIGKPNQAEAVMSNFEKRAPRWAIPS